MKALVLYPGALGDFICFLPALRRLSRTAAVDVLARSEYAGLIPPGVRLFSLERREVTRLFLPSAERDGSGAEFFGGYEAVYSWLGSLHGDFSHALAAVTSGRARLFPFRPIDSRLHMVDYYLSCLGELSDADATPMVSPPQEELLWVSEFLRRYAVGGQAILVWAPGSGSREKSWPLSFFGDVTDWWRRERGGAAIALLGPAEEDRGISAATIAGFGAVPAGGLSLSQVAALLRRADVYLGNDSGVTHLAAAVGARTVALFGPSDPLQWAPRGAHVSIIGGRAPCSPCGAAIMKECPRRVCLDTITPREVIFWLKRMTGENPGRRRLGVPSAKAVASA
jgi:ADP-heptose:LPS heptosyltransferase